MNEGKALHILLINDDEDDSFILFEVSQYFKREVFLSNMLPCNNIAANISAGNIPDVILLDLYMANNNGMEILKQIRTSPTLKNIPVIIYSSTQQTFIVKKCFDLGATLFVEKPHTYKGVERMLKKIIAIDWKRPKAKAKQHTFILETEDSY